MIRAVRLRLADGVQRVRSTTLSDVRAARWLGWTLAIGSTFAFSFAPPVARAAILGGFDSNALLMARMVITTLLFGATLAITDRSHLKIARGGLGAAMLVGAINGIAMIAFFLSLNYLEASLTAMILALSPPLVLSLLALRGERLTRRHLVRVGLALAGVFLLVNPAGDVNWHGAALAIFSTCAPCVRLSERVSDAQPPTLTDHFAAKVSVAGVLMPVMRRTFAVTS